MKRNSAAFLALLLSATMAVAPAASVMADGEIPEQALSTEAEELPAQAEAEPAETEESAGETEAVPVAAETETVQPAEMASSVENEAKEADPAPAAEKETTAAEKVTTAEDTITGKPQNTGSEESKTHAITATTCNSEGAVSGMYSMDTVIVTEQTDGTYLVRMHQRSVNRNLLALTDNPEAAAAHEVDWYQGGGDDGYWFVIPVNSLAAPLNVCFSSTDRVAAGKAWSNVQTISFDLSSMTDTSAAEVTASEIKLDPAAGTEPEAPESKTHAITITAYNSSGSVSGMYSMDQTIVTEQEDGTYLVRMHQRSVNRNLLALTDNTEAATAHEVDWYQGGGDDGYWFVIPVNSLSESLKVCFSSTERVAQGKDWSSVQTLVFDETTLADTDAAEVTASEIKIDPASQETPDDPDTDPDKDSEKDPATDPDKKEDEDKPEDGKDDKEDEKDPDAGEESKAPADGIYSGAAQTNANMFKVTDVKLTSKGGKMTAVITLSGTGYDYLYMGSKEEAFAANESAWIPAVVNKDGQYTYEIPVAALDTPLAVASRSARYAADGKGQAAWLDRTITIASDSLIKIADVEEEKETLPDGIYSGLAETNALMFKVIGTTLTSKAGKMTAVVTLSGTGYDYLYMGSKEEAFATEESAWIPAVVNKDGQYTYEIPVEALDTPLAVASRSARYAADGKGQAAWLDRTITIVGSSLVKTADLPEEDTPADTPSSDTKPSGGDSQSGETKPSGGSEASGTEKPNKNDGKAENESKYESDLSGATSAVDSSTSLKDGVYTPSSFSWSGGTGKVRITCNKVTVQGGKAYATIAFSSSKFGYVKANGNTYYPTVSGGQSIFTIPVQLNKNNTIIGMTTAMSAAHEIAYNIFVSIPGAGGASGDTSQSASGMVSSDNTALDEKAPEIVGLEYESETELEEAEFFKIYNYEKGITLLEIDMTKDTERDPELEKNKKSDKKDEKKDDKKSEENSENSKKKVTDSMEEEEVVASEEETTAELYKGNVVKYLIVPEDEEIPVGLEKDMIVVQLPVESMYMTSETGFDYLEDLEGLDLIKTTAVKEDDCKNKTIKKALKNKEAVYAGEAEKPTYKNLIKAKTDLAILPETLVPGSEKDCDLDEDMELFTSLTERFALLGIPVVFDRSADEETELAQAEWIKVYGALVDKQDEAEKLFDKVVAEKK